MRHAERVTAGWLSLGLSRDQESIQPARPLGQAWGRPGGHPALPPLPHGPRRTWVCGREEGRRCPAPLKAGQAAGKQSARPKPELCGRKTGRMEAVLHLIPSLCGALHSGPGPCRGSGGWVVVHSDSGGQSTNQRPRPGGCIPTLWSLSLLRCPGRHESTHMRTCTQRRHMFRVGDTHGLRAVQPPAVLEP